MIAELLKKEGGMDWKPLPRHQNFLIWVGVSEDGRWEASVATLTHEFLPALEDALKKAQDLSAAEAQYAMQAALRGLVSRLKHQLGRYEKEARGVLSRE